MNSSLPKPIRIRPGSSTLGPSGSFPVLQKLYSALAEYERTLPAEDFVGRHPFSFLTEAEMATLSDGEYADFLAAYRSDCIYEIMKLSREHLRLQHAGPRAGRPLCGYTHRPPVPSAGLQHRPGRVPVPPPAMTSASSRPQRTAAGYLICTIITPTSGSSVMASTISGISPSIIRPGDLNWKICPLESLILIYSIFRVKNPAPPAADAHLSLTNPMTSFCTSWIMSMRPRLTATRRSITSP